MRIPTLDGLRGLGSGQWRPIAVVVTVLALSGAGTTAAMASVGGVSSRAATQAADPAGTLTTLPYSFPAGSGGSLVHPLGISAFKGNVYVSNSPASVLSDLNGGNTTTVAGNLESTGESGDGGPANLATLWQPTGTAEDSAGDIYIADTEDNVVRKIDAATGVITRFAGTGRGGASGPGGPATRTQLDAPQGVAVNAAGDVFIADTVNNRVDEVLPNGHLVAFAGDGKAGYRGDGGAAVKAELTSPVGLAVDSAGNVYIADSGNNVIRRVDAKAGTITTVAGDYGTDKANGGRGFSGDGGPATASKLSGPSAVAVDNSTGTLYIADTHNSKAAAVTGLAQPGSAPGPVAP